MWLEREDAFSFCLSEWWKSQSPGITPGIYFFFSSLVPLGWWLLEVSALCKCFLKSSSQSFCLLFCVSFNSESNLCERIVVSMYFSHVFWECGNMYGNILKGDMALFVTALSSNLAHNILTYHLKGWEDELCHMPGVLNCEATCDWV